MSKKGGVWLFDDLVVTQVEPNKWKWGMAGKTWLFLEGSPGSLFMETEGGKDQVIQTGSVNEAVLYTVGYRDGAQLMCACLADACQGISEILGTPGPMQREPGL